MTNGEIGMIIMGGMCALIGFFSSWCIAKNKKEEKDKE